MSRARALERLVAWLPGPGVLRDYDRSRWRYDLTAGLAVTVWTPGPSRRSP